MAIMEGGVECVIVISIITVEQKRPEGSGRSSWKRDVIANGVKNALEQPHVQVIWLQITFIKLTRAGVPLGFFLVQKGHEDCYLLQ